MRGRGGREEGRRGEGGRGEGRGERGEVGKYQFHHSMLGMQVEIAIIIKVCMRKGFDRNALL